MKRNILFILIALLPMFASAYDAEIDGIYYNFSENEAEVTGGNAKYSGDVVIPSSVTYKDTTYIVTSIGNYAFYYCRNLTSITIPEGVTNIGGSAFSGCSGLTSITIPESVTSIGNYAFSGCSALTSVSIPNSVTYIGSYAFKGCSGLTSVPKNLTYIGADAFEGTTWYDRQPDGLIYVGKVAYKYKGNMPEESKITIKKGTLGIAGKAFLGCKGLTSITIPESVTSIGYEAFCGCSGLTSITISESVANIGGDAFYGCYFKYDSFINHTTLTSDDNWGATLCNEETSDGLLINDSIVIKCRPWATSVTIPDYVTSIDSWAFSGCFFKYDSFVNHTTLKSNNNWGATLYSEETSDGLLIKDSVVIKCRPWATSVTIPNSVTTIDSRGFQDCQNLESIKISKSVTAIRDYTFSGCGSLNSIKVERGNPRFDSRNKCNAIIDTKTNTLIAGCKNTDIPNSVTSIGESAFRNCNGLTSINIPESVASIGSSAFSGTAWYNSQPDGLVYAGKVAYKYKGEMPEGTQIVIKEGTLGIADYAFLECKGMTSINIPEGVTNIGYSAFSGCSNLKSVNIPESVTSIENNAFSGTAWYNSQPEGLVYAGKVAYRYKGEMPEGTQITIKEGTLGIAVNAFEDCSGLTSVDIPESVTNIGYGAFRGCSGLRSVNIPESVTSIGRLTFYGCSSLTSIKVETGNTKYDSRNNCNAIIETATNTLVKGCMNTFIPESVTSIEDGAFFGCSSLTSVTIPESVTSIGRSTFYGCSSLTSIKVEDGNTKYDSRNNCNAIIETATNTLVVGCQSTVIPNSVTNIGGRAFYVCSNLTSITIPNSVTNIGEYAFRGCYFKYDSFINHTTLTSDDNWGATLCNDETSDGLLIKDSIVVKCRPWVISFSIPESVTNIRSNAFKGTAWYDSQPDGLVYIGKIAYKYKGKMPEGTQITIKEGTIGIADGAFYGCSGLTSINIPESVTSIGSGAFRDCTSLTSINIPESVTSIGDWAFVGTAWYRSQKGVVYAGKIACGKSSTLYSITIKEGTMGIADGAFEYCDFSTRVTIPASVTSIGMRAFSDCNELTDVYCLAEEVPKTGRNAFTNTPIKKATLHVPAASVKKYKAASPWSNFGKIVAIEE